MRVTRLSHAVGAEISGVDLAAPLDPQTRSAILAAWAEHRVLLFRAAELTLAQQVAFSREFGELELHPLVSLRHPQQPEIFEVTNRMVDGRPSESAEVGRVWHSDGAYTVRPPTGSLLHCQMIPSAGGSTWFNNMTMAYDALSPALQHMLDPLEVVNDLFDRGHVTTFVAKRDTNQVAADRKAVPAVVQPMVRVHPVTGRRALYLNPAVTRGILGLSSEESEGLLRFLFQHCVKPEFVYCHRWQVHDLVMWDNRCAMHLAPADYDPSETRQMFRTTLAGELHGRYLHDEPAIAQSPAATLESGSHGL